MYRCSPYLPSLIAMCLRTLPVSATVMALEIIYPQQDLNHACKFGFFAGSQKKIVVSPAWFKLAHFA